MVDGLIDKIKESKRSINMGQFVQLLNGSHPKCILVEGAPGVGKSTFAWKLCHKWKRSDMYFAPLTLLSLSLSRTTSLYCWSSFPFPHLWHNFQAKVDFPTPGAPSTRMHFG